MRVIVYAKEVSYYDRTGQDRTGQDRTEQNGLAEAQDALWRMVVAGKEFSETDRSARYRIWTELEGKVKACNLTPFQIFPELFYLVPEITVGNLLTISHAQIPEEIRGADATQRSIFNPTPKSSELEAYSGRLLGVVSYIKALGNITLENIDPKAREQAHIKAAQELFALLVEKKDTHFYEPISTQLIYAHAELKDKDGRYDGQDYSKLDPSGNKDSTTMEAELKAAHKAALEAEGRIGSKGGKGRGGNKISAKPSRPVTDTTAE